MKNLAKLMLFFSLSFAFLFFASVMLGLLSLWIDFLRFLPIAPVTPVELSDLVWRSLLLSFYLSILLTLNYATRRGISVPVSVIGIFIFSSIVLSTLSITIERTGNTEATFSPVAAVQSPPGLILTISNNAIILLRESADVWGARVVSIPGQPLIYHEEPLGPYGTILPLPPLPFAYAAPWFIRNLVIDFNLSAAEMRRLLAEDYRSFGIYVLSLSLLLSSASFLFRLSRWPLASLFFGALVFRGIIALQALLSAHDINAFIYSASPLPLSQQLISPVIFTLLSLLVIFYTLLVNMAKTQEKLR